MSRFYDLNLSAEDIDNILIDLKDVMDTGSYDKPVVLKQADNNKNRNHFEINLNLSMSDNAAFEGKRSQNPYSPTEIEFVFKDVQNNLSVSFTIQELQALKALLNQNFITSSTINAIETVSEEPQSPVENTVYIVDEE